VLQQSAVNFGKLFQGALYRIPDYQRSYSWTEKQLRDLWSDLKEMLRAGNSKHFMGTLVLKQSKAVRMHGHSYETWEVIDGQQRLTSLAVLMACLARRFRNDPDLTVGAENIYDQFIVYSRNGVVEPKLQKLVIGTDDNPFFWTAILQTNVTNNAPATPGQRRLHAARQFFERKLAELDIDELQDLHAIIDEALLFLTYVVGTDLEAGLVFETINDRGKSLSNLDKIKNYLMYLAAKHSSSTLSTAVNVQWGNVLRRVSELDPTDTEQLEDTLVRYHWIAETGDDREYQVYRDVKIQYPVATADASAKAEQYVNRLSEAADLYVQIKRPWAANFYPAASATLRNEIVHYLASLQYLNVEAIFAPLLIASLRRYAQNATAFHELARLCHLYAWRAHKVCQRRRDAGSARLASLAHGVMSGQVSHDNVVAAMKELILRYGGDADFQADLANLEGDSLRFFLWEWEREKARISRQNALSWDVVGKYQIEHIWPQTPKGLDKWSVADKENHDEVAYSLGNLTLVPPPWNPKLSNRPLNQKRTVYQGSTLQLNKELDVDPNFIEICGLETKGASTTNILHAVRVFCDNRESVMVKFALQYWKV
jgi:hypothetical protein